MDESSVTEILTKEARVKAEGSRRYPNEDVSLSAFVVENAGIKIETRQGMGRVAVADRSFPTCDRMTILREKPAIVWRRHDYNDFLAKFNATDKATQLEILDMHHPTPTLIDELMCLKISTLQRSFTLDEKLIKKLIGIIRANAHEYRYLGPSSSHVGPTPGGKDAKHSALFLFGSKVSHSCNPNLVFTSETRDGCQEHKVIQPIKEGDLLTITYIGDLFTTPAYKRREILVENYSFFCKCERCINPDYCRFAKCTNCNEFIPCINDDDDDINRGTWTCKTCGIRDDILIKEQALLMRLETAITRRTYESQSTLESIVDDCSHQLSPVHHITVTALKNLVHLFASKAHEEEMVLQMTLQMARRFAIAPRDLINKVSRDWQWPYKATVARMQMISKIECVSAGCPGCRCKPNTASFKHNPRHDLVSDVFHMCINLSKIPRPSQPKRAVEMVARYLPIMRQTFGQDDMDVQMIEDTIIRPRTAAVTATNRSHKQGEGNNNKKKKEKKTRHNRK